MTPSIERTAIGMQYIIPGTELIEKPKRRVFKADGNQFVIPGAERISTKAYLARLAEMPLQPRRGQVGLRGVGLFGT
jgi:hypothetical protein